MTHTLKSNDCRVCVRRIIDVCVFASFPVGRYQYFSCVCVCVCVRERLHGALSVWCTDDEMCFRSISTISV